MNDTARRSAWTVAVLGALVASPLRSQVLYSGSGSANVQVTPAPVGGASSASASSSFPVFPDDGTLAGSHSGGTTFTATGVTAVGSGNGSYAGVAAQGGVNATAHSAFSYPAVSPNSSFGDFLGYGAATQVNSYSQIQVSDLIFSGPAAAVPVSFNFLFTSILASLAAGANNPGYNNSSSAISISMNYGTGVSIPVVSGTAYGTIGVNLGGVPSTFGLLNSYAGGTVPIQTGVFAAPTGVPITFTVGVTSTTYNSGGYDSANSADAYTSATLPTSGPVFNLPSGYTANSAQLGVVNNSNVPEPQEYAVVAGLSLAGFGLWRRTRKMVR